MTSCDEYQTRIVALFDNEAGDEDLRLVAGHLQDCPECRAFYLDLVAIRRAGATAPMPSLSPGVRQAVLGRVKADQPTARGRAERLVGNAPIRQAGALGRSPGDRLAVDNVRRPGPDGKGLAAQARDGRTTGGGHPRAGKAGGIPGAATEGHFRVVLPHGRAGRARQSRFVIAAGLLPTQAYNRSARQSNL